METAVQLQQRDKAKRAAAHLKKKRVLVPAILVGALYLALDDLNAVLPEDRTRIEQSPQYEDGRFRNDRDYERNGWMKLVSIFQRRLFDEAEDVEPDRIIPVQALDKSYLESLPDNETSIFRLGHSSMLLKIAGDFWLLDPMFSERASPVSFTGPKRFHPVPLRVEDLPAIKGVIISHNHYDHLDEATVRALAHKTERFIVPLGVSGDMLRWGLKPEKVTELDWWQSIRMGAVEIVSTPSQHFSGRGLEDRDSTLWSSWVLRTARQSIYFSGDTGYFPGFEQIGERYGPFDLTIMETGAWDKSWPNIHMEPEQTLQAHLDLKGKRMMPVHNGTFNLAFHRWDAPMERISALAQKNDVELVMPQMGERVRLGESRHWMPWWKD